MNPPPKPRRSLVVVLGGLAAIGAFSIDTYLPAFPAIAADLHTDISHVGYSLTSYFIGISVGQLVYGPILDRFGRRRPMIVGLVIYILAAIACGCSHSIHALIFNRLLLALGGCVGMVGSRAVVRDVYPREQTARVFSTLILFIGVAPIVAPSVGVWIVANFGWRGIFGVLALLASALLAAVVATIPELRALDATVSMHPWRVAAAYGRVLRVRQFTRYALASGAASGALFAYIAGVPFVLMQLYHLPPQVFSFVFGANAVAFVIGSQVNGYLLRRHASARLARVAATVQAVVALTLTAALMAGQPPMGLTLGLLLVCMSLHGFVIPNTTALALHPFRRQIGSASAMMGSIQMLTGALSSALVSWLHNGTAVPMAGVMALCAVTYAALIWLERDAQSVDADEIPEAEGVSGT